MICWKNVSNIRLKHTNESSAERVIKHSMKISNFLIFTTVDQIIFNQQRVPISLIWTFEFIFNFVLAQLCPFNFTNNLNLTVIFQ